MSLNCMELQLKEKIHHTYAGFCFWTVSCTILQAEYMEERTLSWSYQLHVWKEPRALLIIQLDESPGWAGSGRCKISTKTPADAIYRDISTFLWKRIAFVFWPKFRGDDSPLISAENGCWTILSDSKDGNYRKKTIWSGAQRVCLFVFKSFSNKYV